MKKAVGIILVVLGAMAFFGSIVNGSIADFSMPGIVAKLLTIGFVVGGIVLISKSKAK